MTSNSPTVLIVEDEFLVRMIAADSLSESGFTVLEAQDADEALDCSIGTKLRSCLPTSTCRGRSTGWSLPKSSPPADRR